MEHVKWTKTDKDSWTADVGESVPARIKQLDAKTFCVYRGGRYLGAEGDLATAEKRAALNARSEVNREMDWQRAHPDEQPLGLRLTPEERAATRTQVTAAPRSKPAGGLEVLLKQENAADNRSADSQRKLESTKSPSRAAVARDASPRPEKPSGDSGHLSKKAPKGNRDAEILALLKRGCTSGEVLRVTGWQAVSMPQMAARVGVRLRIDKSCKPFRYYEDQPKKEK